MIIELTFISSIIIVGKSIRNVQLMDLQLLMMNTLMDLSLIIVLLNISGMLYSVKTMMIQKK